MKFNITGKVTHNNPEEKKTSKAGKDYTKKTLVIEVAETNNDKTYTNSIAFDVVGEKTIEVANSLQVGQTVDVSFSISSNEYQGQFYTNVRAFNIAAVNAVSEQKQDGDLPF